MHYGKLVTVVHDGIRMSDKELEPIGIHDDTVSWGLWLPDWQSKQPGRPVSTQSWKSTHDHLVMSPFEPSFWPVLFRVELRLDHQQGTLAAATSVLKEAGLNILAINVTETGYHHVTVSLIGEAEELRHSEPVTFIKTYPQEHKHFWDTNLRDYIHKNLAPLMLEYVKGLRKELYLAHARNPFLRDGFVHANDYADYEQVLPAQNHQYAGSAIMYDPLALPEGWQDDGERQRTKAVRCSWLQNLAFSDKLTAFDKPFKTIASLNTLERYVRYMFSYLDVEGRTLIVRIPYTSQYSDPCITSRGFQHELYQGLSHLNLNLRHLSLRKTSIRPDGEAGTLRLLISPDDRRPDAHAQKKILREMQEHIETIVSNATAKYAKCGMSTGPVVVETLGAKTLFLSAKMDWLRDSDRQHKLQELVRKYGFKLVIGSPEFIKGQPMTPGIAELIRSSNAFLQIFPVIPKWEAEVVQWMIFELGVAYSASIPKAVCVPTNGGFTLGDWREHLRIGRDYYVTAYPANASDDKLIAALDDVVLGLLGELENPNVSWH